ncbi:MAG TPA: helical backbone metal receptor [Planctomycetota bacterium]|nr:helical backbone metal receptor [Planctomycetota bacterium]
MARNVEWKDAGGIVHAAGGKPAARIVSLVPSLTETLCSVGGRDRVVGCTAFCIFPRGLLKDPAITIVGGTKTVQREKLLGLNPDLVLLNLEENTLEDIDFLKARVPCYINGVRTLDEGIETIRELGALIGRADIAEPLANEAGRILTEIRSRVEDRRTRGGATPKIFYPIWREPWMSINSDTFIHDHLQTCGAENIFAANKSRYPEVTLEQVSAAAPDIVWLPSEPYEFKEKHKAEFENLPALPAAQNNRIELVNGDNVCWFGARQIEGMEYTFARLWRQSPSSGPLPLEVPRG